MIWNITWFFIGAFAGAMTMAFVKGGTKGDEE